MDPVQDLYMYKDNCQAVIDIKQGKVVLTYIIFLPGERPGRDHLC